MSSELFCLLSTVDHQSALQNIYAKHGALVLEIQSLLVKCACTYFIPGKIYFPEGSCWELPWNSELSYEALWGGYKIRTLNFTL